MTTTMLLVGDVRERLRQMADESVHCIVTSPPYFGLRDYGMAAQIGLEATPDAYVAELVAVFREMRRILRSDGTLWLNLGDSYAGSGKGGNPPDSVHQKQRSNKGSLLTADTAREAAVTNTTRNVHGFAAKQRLGIPPRVVLSLQADGWWWRDEIIWRKPNPMPHSGKDRTTPAHEMLYTLSKSPRYYYDIEAIKEPAVSKTAKKFTDGGADKQRGHGRQHAGFNGRYAEKITADGIPTHRHPRSVWDVAPANFKGAHFATFPPDLIRPCIMAGCPEGGTVLDPFFGAGTTGLVAAEHGRNAIGIELSPEYAAIAAERLGLRVLSQDGLIIGGSTPYVAFPPLAPY